MVTGGTGMIGRQVVHILCDAGARVRVVSLDEISVDDRAEHIRGDLCDFNLCRELTKDMDYVCHVAGIKGSIDVTREKPASFFVPLMMMNTNVLEACRMNRVGRVVYTSSIGAYPPAEVFREADDENQAPPMDMFPGWAKRMAEMQVAAYKIQYGLDNFAVVRPCNVYGPGDNFDPETAMVIPALMGRIRRGENPLRVWGDGSAVRDFSFSRDVAMGTLLALIRGTGDLPFLNLGSGVGVSIRELVENLARVTGIEYEFDTTKSPGFPRRVMDVSMAEKTIGYRHGTGLLQGLGETWEWFLAHESEFLSRKNYFKDAP